MVECFADLRAVHIQRNGNHHGINGIIRMTAAVRALLILGVDGRSSIYHHHHLLTIIIIIILLIIIIIIIIIGIPTRRP